VSAVNVNVLRSARDNRTIVSDDNELSVSELVYSKIHVYVPSGFVLTLIGIQSL